MASLNPLTRELVFKIVFYGPGLGGKTTTLQYIHATTKAEHRGKMVSLATPMDRTLYFDFLPLRIPRVRGMSVRLQLFTVPGQVYYGATRKLVLTGADGVVFVADSQHGRMDANQESHEDLVANLAEHSRSLELMPHTFHWNKRDLSELVPATELDRRFNKHGAPAIGTVATQGDGVFEGLERITRLVVRAYEAELPKGERSLDTRHESSEVGIADAIRGLAEATERRSVTPFAGIPAVTVKPPSMPLPPAASATSAPVKPPTVIDGRLPSGSPAKTLVIADVKEAVVLPAVRSNAPAVRPSAEGEHHDTSSPPAHDVDLDMPTRMPPPVTSLAAAEPLPGSVIFSLVELWSEPEREAAREAEAAIAARDAARAVLACEALVTRVLASAAGLLGSADAPRDPGMAALLLGLDGRRYLTFRSVLRAARQGETVSTREALDCYTFALDARRAREAIGR